MNLPSARRLVVPISIACCLAWSRPASCDGAQPTRILCTGSTLIAAAPGQTAFFDAFGAPPPPRTDAVFFFWEFGDGTTSREQHTTHVYTISRRYDWSLTVTAPGLNSCVAVGSIDVHPPNTSPPTTPVLPGTSSAVVKENAPSNGAIDPGETVTVRLCIVNNGLLPTVDLVGTLRASANVTNPSGPQSYGALPVPPLGSTGRPVCRDYQFTAVGTCDQEITAELQLDDGTTSYGVTRFNYLLGAKPTTITKSFVSADGVPIPDNSPGGVDVPIVVSGVGRLAKLSFRFDGGTGSNGQGCNARTPSPSAGLEHSWVGDLTVRLKSPKGTTVTLFQRPGFESVPGTLGSSGANFCQTVLDDDPDLPVITGIVGSGSIQDVFSSGLPPQGPPYTGTFLSLNALAAFNGEVADGTWTLNVSDNAGGSVGSVHAFSLVFTPLLCTPPGGTPVLIGPVGGGPPIRR